MDPDTAGGLAAIETFVRLTALRRLAHEELRLALEGDDVEEHLREARAAYQLITLLEQTRRSG